MKPLKIGDLSPALPIVQGGMGIGVSLSSLAGAVAKEGGIEVLSAAQIGYKEKDFMKDPEKANLRAIGKHIRRAREIEISTIKRCKTELVLHLLIYEDKGWINKKCLSVCRVLR